MACCSDWKKNKMSYSLAPETIKKRASFTTCTIYFDDVKSDKFLSTITEGYDDGEVYETKEGEFVRRSEIMFSANYHGFDDNVTIDGERTGDRIAAIPFQEMPDIPAHEFLAKQRRFKAVVDSEEKPVELLIGEIGSYVLSEEFIEKRLEFTDMLLDTCDNTIKPRTITTNYASFYSVLWKLHSIFEPVWSEQGYTWAGMMKWMEDIHLPFLSQQHKEKDHARLSIRRYINGLLEYTLDWTVLERRKVMKLCETSKLKNGKYCLAYHPSQRFRDLQELGGVRLKDLKEHTNAVGGSWGTDIWACLVKDEVDDFDSTEDGNSNGLDNTKSKRALLIPVSIFTSTQIMKLCDQLGQNEDYKRFGADEETPSGVVEDSTNPSSAYRNSTQIPGSQGFSLQVSCIEQPVDEDLVFDMLSKETSFFDGGSADELNGSNDEEVADVILDEDVFENAGSSTDHQKIKCMECDASFESKMLLNDHIKIEHQTASNVSKSKPLSNKRQITQITRQNQTFHVCDCGYSSTNKSACSRHKCRLGDSLVFHCLDCTKVCKNAGSLKRHSDSKHGTSKTTLSIIHDVENDASKNDDPSKSNTIDDTEVNVDKTASKASHENSTCSVCSKTLKNENNLRIHRKKVHKLTDENNWTNVSEATATEEEFKCNICGKSFGRKDEMDDHAKNVHKGLSETGITGLLEGSSTDGVSVRNLTEKEMFPCSLCKKVLKSSINLLKHVEVVHKEKSKESENEQPKEHESCRSSRGRILSTRRRSLSIQRHKGKRY